MPRIDLHVVRMTRRWRLQNADAKTLAAFESVEEALENGQARARQLQARGLNARVTIHRPGKSPEVHDFPAQRPVALEELRSGSVAGAR
jgi:hypothetical protein